MEKETWKNINKLLNQKRYKSDFQNYFKYNDENITDTRDVSNKFNSCFINVGPSASITDFLPHNNIVNSFCLQPTTPEEKVTIIKLFY